VTKQSLGERWEQRTEWPLALVAVVFLVVYSVQVLTRPHGEEAHLLWLAGWGAWGLFAVDYIARLALAADRRQWLGQHFFDLMIVLLPLMRPLRLLRLVVLVGVLQKAVGNAVRGRILVYTLSTVVLLVYVSSLAVFDTERDEPGAKITSFGKAVWWAITTVATIGYGDIYPITVTGRVIAVLLMIGGISMIGVVTASLASWIVQRVSETDRAFQTATAAHVDELRDEIQVLAAEVRELTRAAQRLRSPQ
jgi:voltage-gated potassium channel